MIWLKRNALEGPSCCLVDTIFVNLSFGLHLLDLIDFVLDMEASHSPQLAASAHGPGTPEHFHIGDVEQDPVNELAHALEQVIDRYTNSQSSFGTPPAQSRPFGDISGILQVQHLVQHVSEALVATSQIVTQATSQATQSLANLASRFGRDKTEMTATPNNVGTEEMEWIIDMLMSYDSRISTIEALRAESSGAALGMVAEPKAPEKGDRWTAMEDNMGEKITALKRWINNDIISDFKYEQTQQKIKINSINTELNSLHEDLDNMARDLKQSMDATKAYQIQMGANHDLYKAQVREDLAMLNQNFKRIQSDFDKLNQKFKHVYNNVSLAHNSQAGSPVVVGAVVNEAQLGDGKRVVESDWAQQIGSAFGGRTTSPTMTSTVVPPGLPPQMP